ncbi:hypothetical protein ACJMK2_036406 [Sinanodonta woodiana]|uniref:Uncharacterized protein n=1 Tax=Sinanodonta woodiana TaxID=1069815 RepID=A0ABD3WII3_SINWO
MPPTVEGETEIGRDCAFVERPRHYSDSEKVTGTSPPGSLPDVVPISRDRSISLPDVPSFRRRQSELEVGRELRRISDEFHSSYSRTSRVRRQLFSDQAASFPLTSTISLSMVWTSFRQIWTRSPLSTTDTQPSPETHDHYTTQPDGFIHRQHRSMSDFLLIRNLTTDPLLYLFFQCDYPEPNSRRLRQYKDRNVNQNRLIVGV